MRWLQKFYRKYSIIYHFLWKTAFRIQVAVFWVVTPCNVLIDYQRK